MASTSYFTQAADAALQEHISKMTPTPKAQIKAPKVKKSGHVAKDPEPETAIPKENMTASVFALACDAIVRERDRVFLLKVSEDYNIPFADLEAKYLGTSEEAIKVPKQRKAKVTVEGGNKCQAQTAKKGPCSFSALKGECFCKRHLAQQSAPPKEPKAAKEPKVKVTKPVKVEPTHTHGPSETRVAECDLCASHGSALAEEEEFEIVMPDEDEPDAAQAEHDMLAESDGEYDEE